MTRQTPTVVSHAIRESGTRTVFCDTPMPPASAFGPALALDYVRELSTDVIAGVALGPAGELLAGPGALAAPARALLAASGSGAELEVPGADGVVCAVRSPRHALVAVCGRFALAAIVLQDLRAALRALEGEPRAPAAGRRPDAPVPDAAARGPDARVPDAARRAADALISTAQRGFAA
jgi:hypothetical protein